MKFEKVYVLDTNIILEEAQQIITIGENGKNLIVLPETVIDELDNKKSGFDEINFQAREFGRILSEAEIVETNQYPSSGSTIVRLKINDIFIDIISMDRYDLGDVDKSIMNDRKIIHIADFAVRHYDIPYRTIFLSNDIMCRTRAVSLNVKSQGMHKNNDSEAVSFVKIVENINSNLFNSMEGKNIADYDEDYRSNNYCYLFKASDGNMRIGYIVNGKIKFIGDSDFGGMYVKPINLGQKYAMSGMLDNDVDICVIEALAGSGKTLLALAAGMKKQQQGIYDKIIYIRNSVESTDKAEEVGFLSGNDEKFKIYNYPLYDSLEFIAQSQLKKGAKASLQDKVEELEEKHRIETMWIGSLRGRSLSNAFVIIDEVQNFSKASLRTALSRMDKDCKVVCVGSNRQIDHPYINKYTNGLSVLLKAVRDNNHEVDVNTFGAELDKVVRGKVTEFAEKIFDDK